MAKINARSLELIHGWSTEQKAAYNREYYRKNKDRWLGPNGYVKGTINGGEAEDRYAYTKAAQAHREQMAYDAHRKSVDATKEHIKNMKGGQTAEKIGLPGVAANKYYNAFANAMDANYYTRQAQKAQRDAKALEGDKYMIGSQNYYKYWEHNNRAPQAMVAKKPEKKIDKIKRSATKVAKVIGSKAHSAGKAFIDNWKAGWG